MIKRSGFTIIEVLLALFILVSSVYVLSNVQIRSVRRVFRDRDEVDRVFLVKKEWMQAYITPFQDKNDQEIKPVKRDYVEPMPEVKIVTARNMLARSLLGKTKKDDTSKGNQDPLELITTEGTWQKGEAKESIKFVGMVYKPVEKDKKKKN